MTTHTERTSSSYTEPKDRASERKRRFDTAELGQLFQKLPPHAIEAEMSLLGGMMMEPSVIGDVVQILRGSSDFFNPTNGLLYDAIVELYDTHSRLDLVQLHQLLLDRSLLEEVGGQAYLIDLAESVPVASHATHYARLVRDKSIVRQLIGVAGEVIYDAYHVPDDARAILDESERKIFEIADKYERSDIVSLDDLLEQTMEWVWHEQMPVRGLHTFDDLDRMTGGLQPGELTILAARPSMGKTALALNMAELVSRDQNTPVGFFSLEMSKEQIVYRLVASHAGIDLQKMMRNMLNEDERHGVRDACADLRQQTNILVDDTGSLTLLQLRAKARRMVAKHEAKAIFVDYLQLLTVGGRVESRLMEVSEISRGLKALARELEVPVLCLSQLNRAVEQREGHKPRLSDLRESGSIEQDADVVLLLHRESYYHKEDPEWFERNEERANVADLIIAKQRNGPTGVVSLQWNSGSTRFQNLTWAG